jgi:hypothetical protein
LKSCAASCKPAKRNCLMPAHRTAPPTNARLS